MSGIGKGKEGKSKTTETTPPIAPVPTKFPRPPPIPIIPEPTIPTISAKAPPPTNIIPSPIFSNLIPSNTTNLINPTSIITNSVLPVSTLIETFTETRKEPSAQSTVIPTGTRIFTSTIKTDTQNQNKHHNNFTAIVFVIMVAFVIVGGGITFITLIIRKKIKGKKKNQTAENVHSNNNNNTELSESFQEISNNHDMSRSIMSYPQPHPQPPPQHPPPYPPPQHPPPQPPVLYRNRSLIRNYSSDLPPSENHPVYSDAISHYYQKYSRLIFPSAHSQTNESEIINEQSETLNK
ncbi:hypothetical protein C1645_866279 [Glomus cerebriforme]|uniref:Uncharacterized protein n=1 Tax=Glomus cerebriforme TaxID=658196 RepID=A0A397T711_9GLOM|nr:hypothetical protein C1645_866279 [Glomus cerebriforme]